MIAHCRRPANNPSSPTNESYTSELRQIPVLRFHQLELVKVYCSTKLDDDHRTEIVEQVEEVRVSEGLLGRVTISLRC